MARFSQSIYERPKVDLSGISSAITNLQQQAAGIQARRDQQARDASTDEFRKQQLKTSKSTNEAALRRVAIAERTEKRAVEEQAVQDKATDYFAKFSTVSDKETSEGGATVDANGNPVLTPTGQAFVKSNYDQFEAGAKGKFQQDQQALLKKRQESTDGLKSQLNILEQQLRGEAVATPATTSTRRVRKGGTWVTEEVTTPEVLKRAPMGRDKINMRKRADELRAKLIQTEQSYAGAIKTQEAQYATTLADAAKTLQQQATQIQPQTKKLTASEYVDKINTAYEQSIENAKSPLDVKAAKRARTAAIKNYQAIESEKAKVGREIAKTSVIERLKGDVRLKVAEAKGLSDINKEALKTELASLDKQRKEQNSATFSFDMSDDEYNSKRQAIVDRYQNKSKQ